MYDWGFRIRAPTMVWSAPGLKNIKKTLGRSMILSSEALNLRKINDSEIGSLGAPARDVSHAKVLASKHMKKRNQKKKLRYHYIIYL